MIALASPNHPSDIHWAAILGVIISGLALGATLVLLWYQQRQLAAQGRQLKRLDDDRRLDQARHVSGWTLRWAEPATYQPSVDLRVVNLSLEPVYNVQAIVIWGGRQAHAFRPILPPDEPWEETVKLELSAYIPGLPAEVIPIEVRFTDAAGRDWQRDTEGGLHTIEGDRPPASLPWTS